MVEAGGVEPPSENARREENYVRIRLMVFDFRLKAGEGSESLVRLDLDRRLRTEAFGLSRKMTLTDRRAGSDGWSGYLIRQRMQTAYWQFCFSDRFTGARNPARLPTPIQSRRIRCAPISRRSTVGTTTLL